MEDLKAKEEENKIYSIGADGWESSIWCQQPKKKKKKKRSELKAW